MIRDTARIFKALGDETRLRIMAMLMDSEELCVCDIMAALQLPQSTVSRHLSSLRNAGLVNDRRQGVWMYYRVNREGRYAELKSLLAGMLSDLDTVEEDRQRLREHLRHKNGKACA
jgi:ArsR family transcriptional regulator